MPNRCSKSAKKRKNDDVIDLVDSDFDVVKATEKIIKCYPEKVEIINEMRKLSDIRIAAHEKDVAELTKLRKEVKGLKSSITKKFAEADAKVVELKKVLVEEVKSVTPTLGV